MMTFGALLCAIDRIPDQADGITAAKSAITVRQAVDDWLIYGLPRRSRATVEKYKMAGRIESRTISAYGTPVYSAMRNAPAPITGGRIWPPVEAEASAAAANSD